VVAKGVGVFGGEFEGGEDALDGGVIGGEEHETGGHDADAGAGHGGVGFGDADEFCDEFFDDAGLGQAELFVELFEGGGGREDFAAEDAEVAGGVGRAGDGGGEEVHDGGELEPGVGRAVDGGGEFFDGDETFVCVLDDGGVEAVHPAEVVINRGDVGLGASGDFLAGGAVEAVLGEDPAGDVEEVVAGGLFVGAGFGAGSGSGGHRILRYAGEAGFGNTNSNSNLILTFMLAGRYGWIDMGRKGVIAVVLAAVACAAGAAAWWWTHDRRGDSELVLYGNVDLRQSDLAFNNSQRIAEVLVQEGDHVTHGQVLARLETSRLKPQAEQAQAQADAQGQVLLRLRNGNRPEEVAQAKANLDSAIADAANAHQQFERLKLLAGKAISQQDVDAAKTALDVANAKVAVNQKALDLQVAGPRKEDIAQAEAQYRAYEATATMLRQELTDAELKAPLDGVIRSRLMEPGEMASPQKAVFSLAIIDPKWVRAYVSEPDLGKVYSGAKASVSVDSFPDRSFDGWVGFISPTAEFTPKTVQTTELRSSLVYEVRVFVNDPKDNLRLGMPATVRLTAGSSATRPSTQPVSADQ